MAYHNEKPQRFTWGTEWFQKLIDVGIMNHSYAITCSNPLLAGSGWDIAYLELIEGEIIINRKKHEGYVPRDDDGLATGKLTEFERATYVSPFQRAFSETARVWLKHPVELLKSIVMPRVCVTGGAAPSMDPLPAASLPPSWAPDSHPLPRTPEQATTNILLAVEFDSDLLSFGKAHKSEIYARSRIPEYWIYHEKTGVMEIFTEPVAMPDRFLKYGYKNVYRANRNDVISPVRGAGGFDVSSLWQNKHAWERLWT